MNDITDLRLDLPGSYFLFFLARFSSLRPPKGTVTGRTLFRNRSIFSSQVSLESVMLELPKNGTSEYKSNGPQVKDYSHNDHHDGPVLTGRHGPDDRCIGFDVVR